MHLINSEVQLTNHCVLSANGNDKDDANSHNIIFTIKNSWQRIERSVYRNEYKTKK